MAKFVELHDWDTGERMLVNLEKVSGQWKLTVMDRLSLNTAASMWLKAMNN